MIRNVIFDLDGTLLDTREGILESVRYTVKELGFYELQKEDLLKFVGPPIQQSLMSFFECNQETAQKGANIFREYYKTRALLKAKPYKGIYELCERLKKSGIEMAVATYKREDYALTLLRHFGFEKYCNSMHGADNNNILRKEDIVRMCQNELGARKEDSVLIGDTEHDAIGAIKAETPFLAVTYGFGFKNEEDVNFYPHIGVASTPLEIASIILKGEK